MSATMPPLKPRACASYEGCGGRGWLYDLTDSGSGATVYCDCAAGKALQEAETKGLSWRRLAELERSRIGDGSSWWCGTGQFLPK